MDKNNDENEEIIQSEIMQDRNRTSTKTRKKKKKKKKIGRYILLVILFIILVIAGCIIYKTNRNGGGLQGFLATMVGHDEETLKNLDRIDFIIFGESEVDEYPLTDTVMVCSYDPKVQKASMMSIPRDTYVGSKNKKTASQQYLASYKINTVYRGGEKIDDAIERINELTGLDIKYYILIDTKALVELVDVLGGVTFDVPIDMDYDDEGQNLHIHLKAGVQKLDGAKAEQLVRFRHNNPNEKGVMTTYPEEYGDNDIGRMRTQREFLTAVMQQTLKPENLFKIKNFVDIAFNNIKTNLDISVAKDYVPYVVNFSTENLQTGVLPGEPEKVNGVWIFSHNVKETKQMIEELFPSKEEEITNSDITIEILNGSNKTSNLTSLEEKLKEKGYQVVLSDTTSSTSKTAIINRRQKSEKVCNQLLEDIGQGTLSTGKDNSDVDFTIIIGKDYE